MYKFSPTQKIAFSAMLAAIAVVLSSLKIPLGPTQLSFLYIPSFLGGIILGPFYGFAVGAIGDIIGTLTRGFTPSPLITLSNGLIGFIMGFIFNNLKSKNIYPKILVGSVLVYIFITLGLNSFALTIPPAKVYASFGIAVSTRLISQTPVVIINIILTATLFTVLNRTIFKNTPKK